MDSLPDSHGPARRAECAAVRVVRQDEQSNFEKSLAFRLTLLVAIFVIGINLLSPDPTPSPPTRAAVRHTV